METINDRLRKYRKLARFNQTEIAEILGMKVSTYSLRERKGNISCELLIEMSKILNVNAYVLLYGEEKYLEMLNANEKKTILQLMSEPQSPDPLIQEINEYAISNLTKKEHDHIICLRNMSTRKKNYIFEIAYKVLKREIKLPQK